MTCVHVVMSMILDQSNIVQKRSKYDDDTDPRGSDRGWRPDRLCPAVPARFRSGFRTRAAGRPAIAGYHPGPSRIERDLDGTGGLRLYAPGRDEGQRQGRGSIRRGRLGDPGRRLAAEGWHEPGR